ncbi:Putative NAD(P)H nitroreductase YfkO [Pseudoalteromonas sp. CIP111854]|uniref:NAD(P)H nitroreductase YfkO n=1 Tax=Pseudoalteromonas holothuriae TaxID=2963714 RepID=A0A9W4R1F5_9GAMM|nr:NAD(P)H-dependent oxidoreductase [Pseudoalteromonas sp. CIP111854]CAH9062433.1 Putative NAD(P)H nitroreductase YfkO [Pseudoalteromonas sp. CIP111854]
MQSESIHTLQDTLYWRYAVRRFSNKQVSDETLTEILNNTRLSASSYGLQPYKIIVIKDHTLKNQLVEYSFGQNKVADNSHLLVFAADMSCITTMIDNHTQRYSLYNDLSDERLISIKNSMLDALSSLTTDKQYKWASEQAYIALSTLLISAASLQIDTCPIGGIEHQEYDRILDLDGLQLKTVIACPIGYRHPFDYSALRYKIRRPLNELVLGMEL